MRRAERRSVRSRRKRQNRGRTGKAGERVRVLTCREREREKRQPALLPVMSLRGREKGGGMRVLLHENSVLKGLKNG